MVGGIVFYEHNFPNLEFFCFSAELSSTKKNR